MTQFHYRAFGLNIASELQCPELHEATGKTNITIRRRRIDSPATPAEQVKGFILRSPETILLDFSEVGKFLIQGDEIIIDSEADENRIRLFLLGTIFGTVFHERGILPLHGNGIVHDDGCVIVLGHSGSGKSTLAAALCAKGYQVITDDVCALQISSDGNITVFPGYPQLKLWDDALEKLRISSIALPRVRNEDAKFALPIHANFCDQTLPLKRIYCLECCDASNARLVPVTGKDKVLKIMEYTYRKKILGRLGKESEHFIRCNEIAKRTPVSIIRRPESFFSTEQVIELIQDDV